MPINPNNVNSSQFIAVLLLRAAWSQCTLLDTGRAKWRGVRGGQGQLQEGVCVVAVPPEMTQGSEINVPLSAALKYYPCTAGLRGCSFITRGLCLPSTACPPPRLCLCQHSAPNCAGPANKRLLAPLQSCEETLVLWDVPL